jgi:RimJ/RimL family protein N-acetyltransferase
VTTVAIEPWTDADFGLLQRLLGDPAMMEHLGGPESPEKLAERQARYVGLETGCFRVVADGEAVGWVGVWDRDESSAEVGWSVVIEAQGRGIATRATQLLVDHARARHRWTWAHAYPSVDNGPSNAICRKLGFELVDAQDYEWPPGSGNQMRCNDWRYELERGGRGKNPDVRSTYSA